MIEEAVTFVVLTLRPGGNGQATVTYTPGPADVGRVDTVTVKDNVGNVTNNYTTSQLGFTTSVAP